MGRLIFAESVIEEAEKLEFTDQNEKKKYLDVVKYCVDKCKTAQDSSKVEEPSDSFIVEKTITKDNIARAWRNAVLCTNEKFKEEQTNAS